MVTTILEFDFGWIQFSDLTEVFGTIRREALRPFDCVGDRHGVYFFFDRSRVHYVGCATEQSLRKRISQYFKNNLDSGNTFAKSWIKENHPPPQDIIEKKDIDKYLKRKYPEYKSYIKTLHLGTLGAPSVAGEERENELMALIRGMEKSIICQLRPIYNTHFYRLTDNEHDNLVSALSNVGISGLMPDRESPTGTSGNGSAPG